MFNLAINKSANRNNASIKKEITNKEINEIEKLDKKIDKTFNVEHKNNLYKIHEKNYVSKLINDINKYKSEKIEGESLEQVICKLKEENNNLFNENTKENQLKELENKAKISILEKIYIFANKNIEMIFNVKKIENESKISEFESVIHTQTHRIAIYQILDLFTKLTAKQTYATVDTTVGNGEIQFIVRPEIKLNDTYKLEYNTAPIFHYLDLEETESDFSEISKKELNEINKIPFIKTNNNNHSKINKLNLEEINNGISEDYDNDL